MRTGLTSLAGFGQAEVEWSDHLRPYVGREGFWKDCMCLNLNRSLTPLPTMMVTNMVRRMGSGYSFLRVFALCWPIWSECFSRFGVIGHMLLPLLLPFCHLRGQRSRKR